MFRQLAIFTGGFTLEAVLAICLNSELTELEGLERLGELLDQSLLAPQPLIEGENRFGLLAVMREYAWEKLLTIVQ